MTSIYLDHAAATPTYSEVLSAMQEAAEIFGNPSSVHSHGRAARDLIDAARISCAKLLDCETSEIIFTSGATESVNLAMVGGFLGRCTQHPSTPDKTNVSPLGKGRIFLSPLCHASMWGAAEFLEKHFGAEICLLPITKEGFFAPAVFENGFFEDATLIAVEHGNSEIGLIQSVEKIGETIRNCKNPPIFIVDAAASIVTEDISLQKLGADFIALSGEKFGGPKGAGILLKSKNVKLEPLFLGSHEFGFRGGTENVLGIVGIAKSLEIHEKNKNSLKKQFLEFHQFARNFFEQNFPQLQITTPKQEFLPHIFHFLLETGDAPTFVTKCDLAGLSISAGSACGSGNVSGSRVLEKMGFSKVESQRGVRISFGPGTTKKELEKAWKVIDKNF